MAVFDPSRPPDLDPDTIRSLMDGQRREEEPPDLDPDVIRGLMAESQPIEPEVQQAPSYDGLPLRARALGLAPPPGQERGTQYHWTGAAKQAGYDVAKFPSDIIAGAGKLWHKAAEKPAYPNLVKKTMAQFRAEKEGKPFDEKAYQKQQREQNQAMAQKIIDFGEVGTDFYEEAAEKNKDVKAFREAQAREDESILTQALGASGSLASAIGTAALGGPTAGPILAATGFFNLNKEEAKSMALQKLLDSGVDPEIAEKRAEDVSFTAGAINSLLDTIGAGRIRNVFKPAKKLANFLTGLIVTSQIEGGTEAVQSIVSQISADWANKPKDQSVKQFIRKAYTNLPEYIQNARTDYLVGAILGGAGHVVGGGVGEAMREPPPPPGEPGPEGRAQIQGFFGQAGEKLGLTAPEESPRTQFLARVKQDLDAGNMTPEQVRALAARPAAQQMGIAREDLDEVIVDHMADRFDRVAEPEVPEEEPFELTELVGPLTKSAEESAGAFEEARMEEESVREEERRVRQSPEGYLKLKKQLGDKAEEADQIGGYLENYLGMLKEGQPGGRIRTQDYDGTEQWQGYASTYKALPWWNEGWSKRKAIAALEKGLTGKPFKPSERGQGEESIWDAALEGAKEQYTEDVISKAAEIETDPTAIEGMTPIQYKKAMEVLKDEGVETRPLEEAWDRYTSEIQDGAVKEIAAEQGFSEEEIRAILEDEAEPDVTLESAWEDLSDADQEFLNRWAEEQQAREARRGQPRSGGEVETLQEGQPAPKYKPSKETEMPTPDLGPTAFQRLKGALYGKKIRVVEPVVKEAIDEGTPLDEPAASEPLEDKARNFLAEREGIAPEDLKYIGDMSNSKELMLFNITKKDHPNYGSTVSYVKRDKKAEAEAAEQPTPEAKGREPEALYDEAQEIMKKLPANIGKAKAEGKLSKSQLALLDRLDEIEKIFPNTSDEWQAIHKKRRKQYEADLEEWRKERRDEGEAELEKHGFKPGDKVTYFAPSMLGFGGQVVKGTVKIDKNGTPYVSAPNYQKGKLSLKGWKKAEEKPSPKEKAPKDKFISDLHRKGVAYVGGVTYKVLRDSPTDTFYYQKIEDGVRMNKGPGAPAKWTQAEAIDRALEDAKWDLENVGQIAEPSKEEGKPAAPESPDADEQIASWVSEKTGKGETISWRDLFKKADEAYGGTQGEGKYTPKDAYDAMELGMNQWILKNPHDAYNPQRDEYAETTIKGLTDRINKVLPTQSKRTREQQEYQQFSTPPPLAYAANWVANINENDVMVEPSAGIGGIAVFAKNAGAKVVVNELSERRANILKKMGFDRVFTENAEQLNNILPEDVKPTVIVMNPPFSATAGRVSRNKTKYGARHIEQALARLEDNGRLVAIVGRGMADDRPTFKKWWDKIKKKYNVRANVGISGKRYTKYGTSFDNQLIVIDKTGKTEHNVITGFVENLEDLPNMLRGVRNARQQIPETSRPDQQVSGQPSRQEAPGERGGQSRPGRSSQPSPSEGVRGEEQGRPGEAPEQRPGTAGVRTGRDDDLGPAQDVEDVGVEADQGETQREGTGERTGGEGERAGTREEAVTLERPQKKKSREISDSLYERYQPKAKVKGSRPHPTPLVESAAMADTEPPDVTYAPSLPKRVVSGITKDDPNGLSDIQLEAVTYAGQSHEKTLPSGERRAFFIGDGTGVGKGREISGIIMDNWRKGRKKALWISESWDLFKDARRDLKDAYFDTGADNLFKHNKYKVGKRIEDKNQGILFSTYSTLRGAFKRYREDQETTQDDLTIRMNQIVDWLGSDFDGVIAFDESHNMANAAPQRGDRGVKPPSQQALAGIELQRRLPNARVVYVSATGATEVENLIYAQRLGLWGEGTPFRDALSFVSDIASGGVASMEMIARNMKSLGLYLSRGLSYHEVQYDRLTHKLSESQNKKYDELARAWQVVLHNIDEAVEATGGSKASAAMSQFWGAQQRFFNQIITTMQMPSAIEAAKKDIEEGNAVIFQMVNTDEAQQSRALNRREEGQDLEDLDMTPRDSLINYLEHGFPVQEYEEYQDENGNIRKRPVYDSEGNPVINREAAEMRDRLIARVSSIQMPSGPLEYLIQELGHENIAEVTGRSKRIVIDPKTGDMELQKLSDRKIAKDVDDFINDKKQALVFSAKGATGRSFHSDKRYKNQRPRKHYLIQPGWRADKAVQGFGRSHRSNQVSAPTFILVDTDIKGQKRFLSSVARRLDQLGALTKGERRTGSQGIFQARDNLESQYAIEALHRFIEDIAFGRAQSISLSDFEAQTGLRLVNEESGGLEIPNVRQFLNRLLSMEIDIQNKVFDEYSGHVDRVVQDYADRGELDVGIETITGDSVKKVNEQTVYTDEESGATTKYVQVDVTNPADNISFKESKKVFHRPSGYYRNLRSGKIWVASPQRTRTNSAGDVVEYKLLVSPRNSDQRKDTAELNNEENWEQLISKDAKPLWDEEYNKLPKTVTTQHHLITGNLLPIWDRLRGTATIYRMQTDNGERFIGRVIPPDSLNETMEALDIAAGKVTYDPQELYEKVRYNNATVRLRDRWSIKKSTVSGEDRIELTGPTYDDFDWVEKQGIIIENIGYRNRYFIPKNDKAPGIIEEIIKQKPVISINAKAGPRLDENTRLSLATTESPTGVPQKALTRLSDRLKPLFKGYDGDIVVLPSAKNLGPKALKAANVDPNTQLVRGLHQVQPDGKRTIYLFADGMSNKKEAVDVFLEEMFHDGVSMALGEKAKAVLNSIYKRHEADIKKALGEDYGYLDTSTPEGRQAAADEWIAKGLVNDTLPKEVWRRIVTAIRNMLRKAGIKVDLNANEVREMAKRAVVEGRQMGKPSLSTRLQTVFHGTPHIWPPEPGFPHGRPRLDKIGTGEGSGAFGYGWYSAESENVAKFYYDNLSKDHNFVLFGGKPSRTLFHALTGYQRDVLVTYVKEGKEAALEKAKGYRSFLWDQNNDKAAKAMEAFRQDIESGEISVDKNYGSLYTLDIPDDVLPKLLDWDAPLSEQNEYVKKALKKAGVSIKPPTVEKRHGRWAIRDTDGVLQGPYFINKSDAEKRFKSFEKTGERLYRDLQKMHAGWGVEGNSAKSVSEFLAKYGIPGNKYYDQMSRGKGEGTRNYVIWDQDVLDRIALLERNGEKLDAIREADPNQFAQSRMSLKKAVKKITDNPAFNRWFGDSKVVDENGEPLVVYHGTDKDFSVFQNISPAMDEIGFHLGTKYAAESRLENKAERKRVSRGGGLADIKGEDYTGMSLMPVYVNIQNPLRLPDSGTWSAASIATTIEVKGKEIKSLTKGQKDRIKQIGYSRGKTAKLREYLEFLGYDGIVYKNQFEGGQDSYIAFHPTQIKSIFNTTFDPTNPDIRFSLAGRKAKGADTGALAEAQKMAEQGKSEQEIWDKTGWTREASGKWAFRIDDSRAKLKDKALKEGLHHNTLGNLLDHEELYKAYPQLRDMLTSFGIERGATRMGDYTTAKDRSAEGLFDLEAEISVQGANAKEAKSTLLHEISHAIQDIEGFARGGTPSAFTPIKRADFARKRTLDEIDELWEKAPDSFKNPVRIINQELSRKKTMPSMYDEKRFMDALDEVESKHKDLYRKYTKLHTDLFYIERDKDYLGELSPEEQYERLAGEIYAREAGAQFTGLPGTMEGIPRDQWIVKDGDGTSFSVEQPEGQFRANVSRKSSPEQEADDYIQAFLNSQPKAEQPAIKKKVQKETKAFDKQYAKDTIDLWDTVKNLKGIKDIHREGKVDVKSWERLLSVPSHFFHEVPGLGRVYKDGLENTDNRHMLLDQITMAPDGHYYTAELDKFRRQDKAGYRKLQRYLKHRDQNQKGYRVVENADNGLWELYDPKARKVEDFQEESQAVEAMIQAEANDYREAGNPERAVNALIASRRITNNGFQILFQAMRDLREHYEKSGQELPSETVNVDGKAVRVNLRMALAKMGDMRGYYMPRIRKPGRFVAFAKKKGAHPVRKHFDLRRRADIWAANKKAQGYEVSIEKQKKMPEDVFEMAGQVVAQEAIINEALQRMRTKDYKLEDFNLQVIDRREGPGRRDFIVTGPTSKDTNTIFKKMGGRYYASDPGGPRVWHFQNPGAYFEKRLAKAIAFEQAAMDVDQQTRGIFAKALTEQVANVIKGRGVRQHMIKRAEAKGLDVWEGYEEDPAISLAKYARGLSAGEAKKIMARDMLLHFTGTDISWQDFKAMDEDATYEDYLKLVDERRVDPVNQSNAFKEGKSYIEHMLRNEEAVDRLVGTIKGIAVLKYLGGRVSAPLVNLTAMATSVPAAMNGFAGIPINKSFKHMSKAARLYAKYKFGDKASLPKDIRLMFDEIHNKGWHNAQYNREALAVLRGKAGRGWDRLIDWSMIGFGVTEQLNRVTTIAGTYLGMKAQGVTDHDVMMETSKKVSDQAHATYGKANYPFIARGSNPAAQAMKSFYVFKTFSHNYMLTMKDLWGDKLKPQHFKAFSYMAISPAVLAGAGGVVGWNLIMWAIGKASDLDDPEEEMYDYLEANFGEYVERFARFGAFGLIGMNLKGSLEIGVTDLPTSWEDVLGAPGSVIMDFYEGVKAVAKGDISKGIESMAPLAAAGPIKAYREATEGLTTRTNAPIFYGSQRVRADTTDAILRALSFNPAAIAKVREQKWSERKQEMKYNDMRRDIYAKIKRFYLQPAQDRLKGDWADIVEDVREYNERIREKGLTGLVPFITPKSIRTNLMRAFKPTRRELRRRAQ